MQTKDGQDKSKAAGSAGKDGEGEQPQALTPDEVEKMIDAKMNSAISTHLTRFKGAFAKELEGTIAKSLGPIGEQLASLTKKPEGEEEAREKGPSKAEAALQARIKELEEKTAKAESEKQAEREARLRDEERSALANALQAKGVSGAKLKGALALLYTEEKRIGRAEDGKIAFKVQRAGYVDDLDLDKGIDEWLKTDDGKEYMPARPAAGSGAAPARNGQAGKGGKPSTADLALKLAQGMGVIAKPE
jgi:hypothetical protein